MTPAKPSLCTVPSAAERLFGDNSEKHQKLVRRMIKEGALTSRRVGRLYMVPIAAIEAIGAAAAETRKA